MIRRRPFHLWIALCLAVVLPITASGHVSAGHLIALAGSLSPLGSESPAQAPVEEDETHFSAKGEAAKGLGRRRCDPLFVRRTSVLPILAMRQEIRHARPWSAPEAFTLPTSPCLDHSVVRRGPPAV